MSHERCVAILRWVLLRRTFETQRPGRTYAVGVRLGRLECGFRDTTRALRPDLLDANECTWAFVNVGIVGRNAKQHVKTLAALANKIRLSKLLRTHCGRDGTAFARRDRRRWPCEARAAGAKGNPPPPSADVKGSLLAVSRIDASSDHELVVPSVELGHLFLARLPARGGDLGQLFKERLTRRARGEENQH